MNSLLNTDWTFVEHHISTENINIVCTSFITKYKSFYHLAFPLVKVRPTQKRWAKAAMDDNGSLEILQKKGKIIQELLFFKPTPQNKLKFTQYRNKFKLIKQPSELNYCAEILINVRTI